MRDILWMGLFVYNTIQYNTIQYSFIVRCQNAAQHAEIIQKKIVCCKYNPIQRIGLRL